MPLFMVCSQILHSQALNKDSWVFLWLREAASKPNKKQNKTKQAACAKVMAWWWCSPYGFAIVKLILSKNVSCLVLGWKCLQWTHAIES